jgi:hypothetical protein
MTIKYRKTLSIAAITAIGFLMLTPAQAATGDPTQVLAAEAMGTVHVITKVINDNAGTKTPADITMYIRHFGSDAVGSPFAGVDGVGVSFVLKPGTYVVSQDFITGYVGSWSGVGIENGFINLAAGQDVTIIRTNDDWGVAPTAPVDQPTTENGGTLPVTSAPWYNVLVAAILFAAVGLVGLRRSVKINR